MSAWTTDLVFMIRQFLDENQFKDTLHKLEQESGVFFDLDYFEQKGMDGEWDDVEKYLSGFIKSDIDRGFTKKMLYRIRRQKYFEALDRHDADKAIDVLNKDLKVFSDDEFKENYKQLMMLLSLRDFRECEKFSKYGHTITSVRERTMRKLTREIQKVPFIQSHRHCPTFNPSRLKNMVNEGLNWQLQKCQNPNAEIVRKTLYTGYTRDTSQTKLSEFVVLAKCYTLTTPSDKIGQVVRLLYTNAGDGLLALGSTGIHKMWVKTGMMAQFAMRNDVDNINPQRAVAISSDDSIVLSSCGAKISWRQLLKSLPHLQNPQCAFMPPAPGATQPAAVTCLAFYPYDNNTVAIGMQDSTIHVYNLVMSTPLRLRNPTGHRRHITGLSFSPPLNILVSSSADTKLCFWSTQTWIMEKALLIQMPEGQEGVGVTEVQFHSDQMRLLVWHQSHVATYNAITRKLLNQWVPSPTVLAGSITSATYSCDCGQVYASFCDGNIAVLDAHCLELRCRITSYAYVPRELKEKPGTEKLHACVIAAHPKRPNNLALGLSDGTICLIEPVELGGTWGSS